MSTLPELVRMAELLDIEHAADLAYEQHPGPPVTAALAAQLRPLVFPSQPGEQAA